VRQAMAHAGVERIEPGRRCSTTPHFGALKDAFRFVTQYPGLDYEATN